MTQILELRTPVETCERGLRRLAPRTSGAPGQERPAAPATTSQVPGRYESG